MNKKNLQLLNLADKYFRQKNYSTAEHLLKLIIVSFPNNSKAHELLGYIYGNQGKLDLSFDSLNIACEQVGCSPEALYYLGALQLKKNLYNQAITTLKKANNKGGNFFEALHDLGTAYGHLGKTQESLWHYQECLKFKKDSYELYYNIGKCLDVLGKYDEALVNYHRAIEINPNFVEGWFNKSSTLRDLGRFEEALNCYSHVLYLRSDYAEAWSSKALTLSDLMRHDEALTHYDRAIELKPDYAEAWSNKAVTLNDLMRHDEALTHYDRAIELNPDYAEAWSNKAATMSELRRYDEALAHYDKAIELKPDYAEAWSNKAAAMSELRRYDEALVHYDKAIKLKPDYAEAIFNKSILNLNRKNFVDGWKGYGSRLLNNKLINFNFPLCTKNTPVWAGNDFCKHLLVIFDQGIGDQIFYMSMLSQILHKVNEVTVFADKKMKPIIERSFPSVNFHDENNTINPDLFCAQIPLGNLPIILDINASNMDVLKKPYLTVGSNLTKNLKNNSVFKEKFICGVAWKSTNKKLGDHKSICLTEFKDILQVPNCEFVNLQYGEVSKDIRTAEEVTSVKLKTIDEIDLFNDIDGLLSIIKLCDIVITTSNVTAHLTGAIGKKTLLLLPYSKGRIWYWHEEDISTWYPSIKQFFQNPDLTWNTAINKVIKELRDEIERKN